MQINTHPYSPPLGGHQELQGRPQYGNASNDLSGYRDLPFSSSSVSASASSVSFLGEIPQDQMREIQGPYLLAPPSSPNLSPEMKGVLGSTKVSPFHSPHASPVIVPAQPGVSSHQGQSQGHHSNPPLPLHPLSSHSASFDHSFDSDSSSQLYPSSSGSPAEDGRNRSKGRLEDNPSPFLSPHPLSYENTAEGVHKGHNTGKGKGKGKGKDKEKDKEKDKGNNTQNFHAATTHHLPNQYPNLHGNHGGDLPFGTRTTAVPIDPIDFGFDMAGQEYNPLTHLHSNTTSTEDRDGNDDSHGLTMFDMHFTLPQFPGLHDFNGLPGHEMSAQTPRGNERISGLPIASMTPRVGLRGVIDVLGAMNGIDTTGTLDDIHEISGMSAMNDLQDLSGVLGFHQLDMTNSNSMSMEHDGSRKRPSHRNNNLHRFDDITELRSSRELEGEVGGLEFDCLQDLDEAIGLPKRYGNSSQSHSHSHSQFQSQSQSQSQSQAQSHLQPQIHSPTQSLSRTQPRVKSPAQLGRFNFESAKVGMKSQTTRSTPKSHSFSSRQDKTLSNLSSERSRKTHGEMNPFELDGTPSDFRPTMSPVEFHRFVFSGYEEDLGRQHILHQSQSQSQSQSHIQSHVQNHVKSRDSEYFHAHPKKSPSVAVFASSLTPTSVKRQKTGSSSSLFSSANTDEFTSKLADKEQKHSPTAMLPLPHGSSHSTPIVSPIRVVSKTNGVASSSSSAPSVSIPSPGEPRFRTHTHAQPGQNPSRVVFSPTPSVSSESTTSVASVPSLIHSLAEKRDHANATLAATRIDSGSENSLELLIPSPGKLPVGSNDGSSPPETRRTRQEQPQHEIGVAQKHSISQKNATQFSSPFQGQSSRD